MLPRGPGFLPIGMKVIVLASCFGSIALCFKPMLRVLLRNAFAVNERDCFLWCTARDALSRRQASTLVLCIQTQDANKEEKSNI